MEDKNDVEEAYAELKRTLEAESVEEESAVASDQKPTEEVAPPEQKANEDESAELSEDDISKLSPRAQKRIREQADEIKRLAAEATKVPDAPKEEEAVAPNFKDVKEFLAAVQDEPSRLLLEKFYGVIKGEMSSTLAPIEQKNNEAKFESEFSKYEKIEGLANYKNDLRKTFLRNPNQDFKSLVGATVLDLQTSKISPIEKQASTPNRGKVNTDNLSKDELYNLLDSMKGN